jgi:hypothetical protein
MEQRSVINLPSVLAYLNEMALSAAFVGLVTRNCLIGCYGLIGCHQFAFPATRVATVHELAILRFLQAEHRLPRTAEYSLHSAPRL